MTHWAPWMCDLLDMPLGYDPHLVIHIKNTEGDVQKLVLIFHQQSASLL